MATEQTLSANENDVIQKRLTSQKNPSESVVSKRRMIIPLMNLNKAVIIGAMTKVLMVLYLGI